METQFVAFEAIDDQKLHAASGGAIHLQNLLGHIPGRIRRTDAAVALAEHDNQRRDDGPSLGCCWPA